MKHLNSLEYLKKYTSTSEFPNEEPLAKLPLPTDALSKVADPLNWTCFPEDIVRIYLTQYDSVYIVGIGDYEYPTVCTKVFETLDEACFWLAHRPQFLSRTELEQNGFEFKPIRSG